MATARDTDSAAPGAAGPREAALLAELAAGRRLQARYVFLLDLSDALRALGEPLAIKATACELLGRHLGLSRVAYVESAADHAAVAGDFVAEPVRAPSTPDPGIAGSPGPALRRWLEAACGDAPLVVADVEGDARLDAGVRDDLRRLGTAAFTAVRIERAGRPLGWLELHAGRPRDWTPEVLELQAQVADRVAVAVQRARNEAELRSSQARLDLAAASADVGVYDYDVVGGQVIWDARVRAIWGFEPHEPFSYDAFLASMHPDDRVQADRATARALDPAGDGRYAAEYRVLNRRDGSTRWVAANGQVFFEHGSPVRLVGTIQDVSRRKAVETTLRAFYEVSPLMMGTVERLDDGDLLHLYDNPATSRFFGVEPGSTAGRSARALGASESTIETWRRHYDEAGRRGAPVSFEYLHESLGSGPPQLLAVTVAPLGPLSTTGRPAYCYVAEDVTERRAAERQLAAAVAELERADRAKDEFLATLSHELRNPLAPIRTAAQLLSSPRITPGQLQWAQSVIQRQVAHMAWLLDDLLDVARITQGKLVLKTERVALTRIVDAAVESARPQVDGRSHQLLVDLPDAAPVLEADPLRLAQVISNLLTNAAKYTDPGGRIELAAGLEQGWLVVRVRDNGIGIPVEAQARIFDMFSQVEGTAARAEGGLGIGLALVRGLVTLHGGTVAVHSEGPGRGSEFVVRLPLGAGGEGEATAPGEPGPSRSGRGRRILVADDNRDAADMLALYLGMEGHEVRVAHSGRAALALAHAFRPDVALLDIGMPELDGYQVAEALRREAWARGLRLIAITGWGQDEDRRRAYEAGFDAHLTKPVDPEALAAMIDAPDPPR